MWSTTQHDFLAKVYWYGSTDPSAVPCFMAHDSEYGTGRVVSRTEPTSKLFLRLCDHRRCSVHWNSSGTNKACAMRHAPMSPEASSKCSNLCVSPCSSPLVLVTKSISVRHRVLRNLRDALHRWHYGAGLQAQGALNIVAIMTVKLPFSANASNPAAPENADFAPRTVQPAGHG